MLRKTLFVLAIASALTACGKESKDPGKGGKGAKEQAGAAVNLLVSPEDLLTIQSNALASGPVITGSVQPERNADLRAEVSAVVIQVMKENGEVVKRGDVLVRLDETSIRDSLNSAEEASRAASQVLEQSERMFQRMKTLRASGMTSTQALEDAEIRRNNAQSDLSAAKSRAVQARQQLQRTLVRAPFDGIVSERKVSNGDTAQIGKELIKVIDPTSMRLEGLVSADKIGVVKVGQPVLFRINGYPGQDFAGKVRRVDPAANAVTRQVAVLVDFNDKEQPRVAGLYAEGRIETETVSALMIPDSALVKAGDVTYTWKVKDKALHKVTLRIGARDVRTGQWEVKRGLASCDTVLRTPGSTFKDGQKVELTAAKSRAAQARQQLQRTLVRAPFDGIVSERKVSNGDTAQIGKELIKVIDPTSMRLEGLVSADKIGVVRVGQPVLFRINGYPGQDFAGKVRRVDPAANAVTRQVAVLVDFNDKEQPRVAGLYAEGRIETETVSALMIPDSALVKAGDVTYTWKVKDKALHKANLRIGARDVRTGQWEVQSGLASGDTVLRTPGSTFKDGQKVELTAAKALPAAAMASSSTAVAGKGN